MEDDTSQENGNASSNVEIDAGVDFQNLVDGAGKLRKGRRPSGQGEKGKRRSLPGRKAHDTSEHFPTAKFRDLIFSEHGPKGTSQRLVLLALLHCGDYVTGEDSFPGRERLKEMTGCSLNTLDRALQALEADGWIRRERVRRNDGTYAKKVRFHFCRDEETRRRWKTERKKEEKNLQKSETA